jgi:hypothetical protein
MKRIALFALAALAVALLGVSLFFNQIATGAVERGGSYTLGVETRLLVLRLSPLSGGLSLRNLSIANPDGFEADHFLTLGSGSVEVDIASLLDDPIRVRRIELQDIEISIERGPHGTNYGKILDHLAKNSGPPAEGSEASSSGAVIDEIVIRNIRAHLRLGLAGKSKGYDVEVPELRMRKLGKDGQGIQIAQVMAEVTKAILKAVATQSAGLAGDLTQDLNRRLARVGVPDLLRPGAVEETAGKLVEGLGGLFKRD